MRAWSQDSGNNKVPRDGMILYIEDPEYWENFAGYLAQQLRSDVLAYSDSPVIDKPTRVINQFTPHVLSVVPEPAPFNGKAVITGEWKPLGPEGEPVIPLSTSYRNPNVPHAWKPANPSRHYKKQWQKRGKSRRPRGRSNEAQAFRDKFTHESHN